MARVPAETDRAARRAGDPREILLARLGAPRGRDGSVSATWETDWPHLRFRPGAIHALRLADGSERRLTVADWGEAPRPWIRFSEVETIAAAAALSGAVVVAPAARLTRPEPDVLLQADLLDRAVVSSEGRPVGRVVGVEEGVASDWIVVRTHDVGADAIVLDAPAGLLELNRAGALTTGGSRRGGTTGRRRE